MRRRVLPILLFLGATALMPAVLLPAVAQTQVSPFDAGVVADANKLVVEKRYREALDRLKPILHLAAGNIEFDLVYGIALLETGSPADATVAFRRALVRQPDNMLARAHLAKALANTGRLDEAKREIEVVRARSDLTPAIREVMDLNLKQIDAAIARREDERKARQMGSGGGNLTGDDAAAVRRAAELARAQKSAEALAILTPLAGKLSGDPDFDYVYGVASLDAGRPAEAVVSLRRAVEKRPGFHLARAELGRALAAMGDLSGARREFEQVRDVQGLPAPVRDAMGRQVIAIDSASAVSQTAAATRRITGYFETALGYDTNVNGGPLGSQLVIPALSFLGPAQLNPGSLPKKSGFFEIAGGISFAHAIDNDTAFYSNTVGNLHRLFQHDEFNTALVGSEIGIARRVGEIGIFSISLIGQAFWLDTEIYRGVYGAAGQWRRKVGDWDAALAVTWLGLEYPNSIGMDADRYAITGSLARRFEGLPGQPAFSLTLNGGQEIARNSAFKHLSFDFVGARYTGEIAVNPQVIFFGQISYEIHKHHADYPLFDVHRDEQLFEVLWGMELKLNEKVSVRPTVRWSKTLSNVDLFDTERWIGSVATRWAF